MKLVQITAGVAHGDAVTNYVFSLNRYLKDTGIFRSTRVYAETISGIHRVGHLSTYTPTSNDFIIYHHSVGLLYLENFLMPGVRPLLIYHNVTPPGYYLPWDFRAASRMQLGRDQLHRLAGLNLRSVALSEFSASDLRNAGFTNVTVLPYPLFRERSSAPLIKPPGGDGKWKEWLADDTPIVLFVGRIAPNKGIDLLLKAFAVLGRSVRCRLIIVGSLRPENDRYGQYLQKLSADLQLGEHVSWAGFVSDQELDAIYSRASLYLSLSQHEGFGVPLIEAMVSDVPVLAYCSSDSSVAEVLGGAGIGFTVPDVKWVAQVAGQILTDQRLRSAMIDGQRRRVAELKAIDVLAGLRQIIEEEIHGRRNPESDF